MVDESDGIEDAFAGQLRIAITAAGRAGEMIARAREESARRAQAASEQQARELASRFETDKQLARVELSPVYQSQWWDNATPEQIGGAYTTARAWAGEDVEAVRAEQHIRDELHARYGVDNAAGDAAAVRDALERADRERRHTDEQRRKASAEEIEAAALLRHADAADRDAESQSIAARGEPAVGYDSAERRQATARDLEQRGVSQEAIAAKMRADVSQAKPATEAVKSTPARAAKARPGRARGAKVQRTEMGR